MTEKDTLQRFLFENAPVRGEFVHLEESLQTIMEQHQYPLVIRQVLAEMLVAASLLSASIKFNGRLSVQFQGQDRLKLLLVQCNHEFKLRGLAQWTGEFTQEELLAQLKKGVITITIDPETGVSRYQGVVAWEGNSFAESIEGYFKNSEQLPTRIWIAVDEKKAAGLLIQAMPTETADHPDWEHLSHLSATITPPELLTVDNKTLIHRLYNQEDVRLFESVAISFGCTCTVERSENALLLLGQEEVEEELHDKQTITVKCEFCSREYVFDRVDIAKIFKPGNKPASSSNQIH